MKTKKQIIIYLGYFLFLLCLLVIQSKCSFVVLAASKWLNLPTSDKFGNLPSASGTSGVLQFNYVVTQIYQYVRYLIGSVCIAFIVYSGYSIIAAGGGEEELTKQKKNIAWSLGGLFVISGAELARKVFDFGGGGWLTKPTSIVTRSQLFNEDVYLIITFIKYIIGAIAVGYIVFAASKLVAGGGTEDEMKKVKKNLMAIAGGLIMIAISDAIVKVFYKVDTNRTRPGVKITLDPDSGVQQIVGFTSFLVNFAGPVAILGLMIGTIYYVTALGDDAKMGYGKTVIKSCIIGLILIYGAYAIVNTVVTGQIGTETVPSLK